MTVEQNISAVLEMSEPDPESRGERLEKLLDEFGLTRLRSAPAMALSGGERRRCEIARALAANPSIMLLDEPFAGIDPISISDIRDLVKELKTRGIGVLITDHNVRETLRSWTVPASFMAGRSCLPDHQMRWSPIPMSAASIWARALQCDVEEMTEN